MRHLQAETGIHRKLLAEKAHQVGIRLTAGSRSSNIDEQWLRTQYLDLRKSTADIAAEVGLGTTTIQRYLSHYQIPTRPALVHSRTELLHQHPPDLPDDIRRAVQGQLRGWHRLLRFQHSIDCDSLVEAGQRLGIRPNGLRASLRRLERDIGAKLFTHAHKNQLMRPTERGRQLAQTLAQPEIQAQLKKWTHT